MIPGSDRLHRYNDLINDLEGLYLAGLSAAEIKTLVTNFETQIQSKRVCSHIKDLKGLINILEARNILKLDNVEALSKAAQVVGREAAIKRVEDYQQQLIVFHQRSWIALPRPPVQPSHRTDKGKNSLAS